MNLSLEECVTLLVDSSQAPSLLTELRALLSQRVKMGSGPSVYRGGIPLCVDAFDLLQAIEREWGVPPERQLSGLRSWSLDVSTRDDLAWRLTGTIVAIRRLLDPPRRLTLNAPCPACGARTALRRDSSGQCVQTPALIVSGDAGALCVACGRSWAVSELEQLGVALGCAPLP